MAELSYAQISALLKCDSEAGKLFWRERPLEFFKAGNQTAEINCRNWNSRWAGKEAFTHVMSNGYHQGNILLKRYLAHRVVWLLCTGEWPREDIDHINGIRTDNRIANLRAVTRSVNLKNMGLRSTNKSGVHGVCWEAYTEKWKVQIRIDGKTKNLGRFSDLTEAAAVRKAAAAEYGYHENDGKIR